MSAVPQTRRKLVISLHDATPFHLERMRRAEAVYRELGVSKITYLLVPEYHGGYPSAQSPEFIAWCREPRPFAVEWHLHGFHHLEAPPGAASAGGAGDAFKRRFLTAGEGEFLALDPEAQRRKLEAGKRVFRDCLQADPIGFVAPAWLFNASLPPLLKESGFRYTEDHRRIYQVEKGAQLDSPVITWATRTFLRKYGSLAVCPALARLWAGKPVLRVAMHPFDFDHGSTTANIRAVLRHAMRGRDQVFSSDLDFP
jgi:predicted deacetylase